MKSIVDKSSPQMEQKYFEKGLGNTPERLIFGYRLTTDKAKYIREVVEKVNSKVASVKSVEVNLVFVKGIPERYAVSVRDLVVAGISDSEDTFIDMNVYVDISIGMIRHLESRASGVLSRSEKE